MRLQLVTGRLCFVFCADCGQQTAIGDGASQFRNSPGVADLDGEPFKAYYCQPCAEVKFAEIDRINAAWVEGTPNELPNSCWHARGTDDKMHDEKFDERHARDDS